MICLETMHMLSSPAALSNDNPWSFAQHKQRQRAYLKKASVLIEPKVAGFSAWQKADAELLINAGYRATKKQLPKIRELMSG